jgi:hypothetical protein
MTGDIQEKLDWEIRAKLKGWRVAVRIPEGLYFHLQEIPVVGTGKF